MTQQWLASVQQCTGDNCEPRGRVKLWLTMCAMLHVQTACAMPSTMRHSAPHNVALQHWLKRGKCHNGKLCLGEHDRNDSGQGFTASGVSGVPILFQLYSQQCCMASLAAGSTQPMITSKRLDSASPQQLCLRCCERNVLPSRCEYTLCQTE
eukprot:1116621-Amphidinium_carterae.1